MQHNQPAPLLEQNLPPGLIRRLAAIAYDCLLLCGLLLVASLPLPLISHLIDSTWWARLLAQGYLLLICLLFFSWFWVNGGQTLGMRAWRIRVVQVNGAQLDWRRAITRFFAAILSWLVFGLGFVWILFDKNKKSWHDHLSRTRLLVEPKRR